jgi:hypothetical protein
MSGLMPIVQHHLDTCPDCREEFEALLRILKASPDFLTTQALWIN